MPRRWSVGTRAWPRWPVALCVATVAVTLAWISPAQGIDAGVVLTPNQGPPGTQVSASGTGPAGQGVDVSGFGPNLGVPLARTITDASGRFIVTFTVPAAAPVGTNEVYFSPNFPCEPQCIGTLSTANFTVTTRPVTNPPVDPSRDPILTAGGIGETLPMTGTHFTAEAIVGLLAVILGVGLIVGASRCRRLGKHIV